MDWGRFESIFVRECLLHGDFSAETQQRVLSLEGSQFGRRILLQEFVDGQITTANLDHNLATLYLDHDSALAKLVDALRLAHEHNLQLLLVGVAIDVF